MAEKILIVVDDLDTLRLVGLLLQRKGYQIVAADNGKQGLEKANAEIPDLILLDVMMPDMDGVAVLKELRSKRETAEIPVIMFTAKTQVEDKVTGFEAGADDYLTKPTHPAELTARVRTILARNTGNNQSESSDGAAPQKEVKKGQVIGVLAAQGGVGTTTAAVNLAIMTQQVNNAKSILAELRPGAGTVGITMGLRSPDGEGSKILQKEASRITKADVDDALISHNSGLQILLAPETPSEAKHITAVDQYLNIIEQLSYGAQSIILDLGASLPPLANKALDTCDQIVIVMRPTIYSIQMTKRLLDEISMKVLGPGRIHVVQVNHHPDQIIPVRDIQDKLGHGVAVTVSYMPELAYEAEIQRTPMALLKRDGVIAQQFQKLANTIAQNQ
jgi:CheY-like chemotaxis protein/MinD-like ATPase involved in chromosome partitioning or flagellar assembly